MLRKMLLQHKLAKAYMDAMAGAQLLERTLSVSVDVTRLIKALPAQVAELRRILDKPSKGPMGPLEKQLRQSRPSGDLPSSDIVFDAVKGLIEQRNRLAHEYLIQSRDTVGELRAAISELRGLRREFLLMCYVLGQASADAVAGISEVILAMKQGHEQMWEALLRKTLNATPPSGTVAQVVGQTSRGAPA